MFSSFPTFAQASSRAREALPFVASMTVGGRSPRLRRWALTQLRIGHAGTRKTGMVCSHSAELASEQMGKYQTSQPYLPELLLGD